jgi:uncharacterized membrane protein HdeD (DUF308 family)
MMNIESVRPVLNKASPWLVLWSVVVLLCGVLAIILPLTFSVGIAFFIGSLALVAGVAHFVFAFHDRGLGGFAWHMLLGALYELTAIYLLANPLLGIVSLALILAIFLLLEGILEVTLYFSLRRFRRAVLVLIDGIITLILGVLMIRQWPPVSSETIGVLIGISLIFSAVSRLVLVAAIRQPTSVSS